MTTWTPFTLAVVTNALPTDVGQLYTNWITAHPEKANRLAEIVAETRQAIRDAVSTNPRNIIDTATDTVPTVGFRHGLNMVFFSLGMEMGAQMGPDAHSQMLRADLWLRMVQTGGIPMAVDVGMRGGTPSYKAAGTGGKRMKHGVLCVAAAVVALAGSSFAGWLNPAQPGFTADETLLRIAGDQAGVASLAGATDALWRVMGSHNHDGRYDPAGAAGGVSNALLQVIGAHNHDGRYDAAGAANAVCNTVLGAVAGEVAARAAFDLGLQATNGLVLYGHDLYRETVVDGPPGWLDWRVQEVYGQSTVSVWAHWDSVILNAGGSVDEDQTPDFGASDYGPFAWILDPDGNYRVPQVWQDGDHFANFGPDNAVACSWNWQWWYPGETTVDGTVIDAVGTGYTGSDYVGTFDDCKDCPVAWHVSDDGHQVSYTVSWQASQNAPPYTPLFLGASSLWADIRIRPVADLAFVWDGGRPGYLCNPDGVMLAYLGYGAVDPPVLMYSGCYFDYPFMEWYPNVNYETGVNLVYSWLYGHERHNFWFQVPTAWEVTNTVNAAIAGDTTRYLKGEVDDIAQGVRDDLGAQVVTVATDMATRIAVSTNLLAPALVGQFRCGVAAPDSNGVVALAWSNSPFLVVANTNACFVQVPAAPAIGTAVNLFFDCQGTNALLFTRPVAWASAPPVGRGLYELYGNPIVTNAWRGWAMSETRAPVAYTSFWYGIPPQGPISNGLFAAPVGVVLGNGATSNGLPATVAVVCQEQTQTGWTALPLNRTNLYAGDVHLPFGNLRVAFSNAADPAVSGMRPFSLSSGYHLEFNGDGAYQDLNWHHSWGFSDGYPDFSGWYFNGTQTDGTWGGIGTWFIDNWGTTVAPGFSHRYFRAGSWGGANISAAIRSPAITGLVSQVRFFVKVNMEGINGLVEYCPLSADWTQTTNWVALGSPILAGDWEWVTYQVAKTNGYFRFRVTPASQNSGPFLIAYIDIN